MKKLWMICLLAALVLNAGAQHPPLSADDLFKEACQQATKESKNVFIMFSASWCVWCTRMDLSIKDSACYDFFNKNYVMRHIIVDESPDKLNLENPGGKEFRTKYNGDGQGIPFWLVFDKKGKLLADSRMKKNGGEPGDNTGCPASDEEVTYFITVLGKTADLNKSQAEAIRKRFRENDR